MPIDAIADWEARLERQDAFWDCAIIDRPVVNISFPKEPHTPAPSAARFANHRERWLDVDFAVERALHQARTTEFLGDALPKTFPYVGPEVFAAFFGAEMEYGEATSWSIPNLEDWSDVDAVRFSTEQFYWRKVEELTDALLDAGKGVFYTGYTDIHTGGDALASFRDPANLNMDMLTAPEQVSSLLAYVNDVFIDVFNYYVDRLQAHGQAIASWPGIVSSRRWHVPSNDFSCMISKEMFDEVFLPGIVRECRNAEASIYHLDGPDALRHLDSLLEIKELNAIQWVYGAGRGGPLDWLHVYKRCQDAGKGLQIGVGMEELDTLMENLKPEGVWLSVGGVRNTEQADEVIRRVSRWGQRTAS
jgi:hypothetical protein